jgi:hypothetical protein
MSEFFLLDLGTQSCVIFSIDGTFLLTELFRHNNNKLRCRLASANNLPCSKDNNHRSYFAPAICLMHTSSAHGSGGEVSAPDYEKIKMLFQCFGEN